MTFDYTALNAKGEQFSSNLEAKSEADAIKQLRELGYYPTSITRAKKTKVTVLDTEETSIPSPPTFPTMTNSQLFYVFFGALNTIFGGSYVYDVSDCDVTGVMMIIIGIVLMVASALILVVEHFNKPTTNRRGY